jgi:hypothetical protein
MSNRIRQIDNIETSTKELMSTVTECYAYIDTLLEAAVRDARKGDINKDNADDVLRLFAIARTDLESSCMFANKAFAFAGELEKLEETEK